MMKKFYKIFLAVSASVLLALSGYVGCGGDEGGDFLINPFVIVIDAETNRIFVIENSGNRINLVDATTNNVVVGPEDQPLLSDEDPQLLPLFPSNAALASLPGGVSRIFVIGANQGPSRQVTVLDYDVAGGLRPAPISPIAVPGSSGDVLVGIAVDPLRDLVFVSNSGTGKVHAFDVFNGVEDGNSPLDVGGQPGNLSLGLDSNLLAVANTATTSVNFFNLSNLANPPVGLNTGIFTRGVALATNANGTVLFLSGAMENVAKVYRLNLGNIPASTLLSEILPPAPTDPLPDPLFLTGNLNLVTAGNLSNGNLAAFYSQSSGDVLAIDLGFNLATLTPTVITLSAPVGQGIAGLRNDLEDVTAVYMASTGLGVVTVIDPLLNEFSDQIR